MKSKILIEKNIDDAEIRLAKIVAELVRQGVTFEVEEASAFYAIVFKGGY